MRIAETYRLKVPNQKGYVAASRYLFGPYLNLRGIEVSGQENLPSDDKGFILAINHRSMLDIPVIGQVLLEHDGTQLHFVAKKELWKRKLMARYLDSTGVIKFDRDVSMGAQPDVVNSMNKVLGNNGALAMFPEGTRHKGAEVRVKNKGLGILAVENCVAIATAGISGTESLFGKIYVNFGKTVEPGLISEENRRRRMVDMEREYTYELQQAVYSAYSSAGELIPTAAEA